MFRYFGVFILLLVAVVASKTAHAHCDTTKGPVVAAARAALDADDPNLVLHWVRPEDEATVRSAFQQTMAVRAQGSEAKALADRYFFETVVRIHRAGEGEPYTGLTDDEPAPSVAATDRALERGSADDLERKLVEAVRVGLAERFAAANAAKNFQPGDVAGGRAFVAAYVPLTHWVEGVLSAARGTGEHHAVSDEHAVTAHPMVEHESGGHADPEVRTAMYDSRQSQYLPWVLTALFAIVALVEGILLLRRRRPLCAT